MYGKSKLKFTREKVQCIDYGLDFYAPQTMETEDGRRILIAWMQSWDNPMYPDTQRYSGMMTIPRELSIKGEEFVSCLCVRLKIIAAMLYDTIMSVFTKRRN